MTNPNAHPDLPWYVKVIPLFDDSIAFYECVCCERRWRPHEVEVHKGTCDRRERTPKQ